MKLIRNIDTTTSDHFEIVYNFRQQAYNKRRKTLRKDNYRRKKGMQASVDRNENDWDQESAQHDASDEKFSLFLEESGRNLKFKTPQRLQRVQTDDLSFNQWCLQQFQAVRQAKGQKKVFVFQDRFTSFMYRESG